MAALAAMLIYTGFRLAHPTEFMNVWRIGREQLVIFVVTLVAVLATDLLIGIAIGIATKVVIHMANGVSLRSLFKPEIEVAEDDGQTVRLTAYNSAVFSNWIPIRRQIERLGLVERKNIVLDLSAVQFIDHTVMDKLHEMENDFEQQGLTFNTLGLEGHQPFAGHAQSARRKGLWTVRRLTIMADPEIEQALEAGLIRLGASGFTAIPCRGAGRRELLENGGQPRPQVRIEVIAPKEACEAMMDFLRREAQSEHRVTFAVETVQVARLDAFDQSVPTCGKFTESESAQAVLEPARH